MAKRTVSKRLLLAQERHRRWLRRHGVRPPGRRSREKWAEEYAAVLRSGLPPRSPRRESPLAGGADATADRSLLARLHREPQHVQDEVRRKMRRVEPIFNKGGLQYVTDDTFKGFEDV